MDRMQEIDEMQDVILEALGAEEAFSALCKALDYDTKNDLFQFLYRVYDLDPGDD